MYQDLLDTLQELNDVHQQLLVIAQKKKQALIDHRVQDVSALVQDEARWVQQAGKLEAERRFQVQKVMEESGRRISAAESSAAVIEPYTADNDFSSSVIRESNLADVQDEKSAERDDAKDAQKNYESEAIDQLWTMEDILKTVQVPTLHERLSQSVSILEHTLLQLREANQLNMRLTNDALHYVEHSIDLMTQARSANINYDRPVSSMQGESAEVKNKPASAGQSFFDTKA